MQLENIDWLIISSFFILSLVIGVVVSKKSGKNITEFFLSGRKMPWWLLGISMVATTFSADTPNLVTDIVRTNGVAGNWVWWAFLLTGMLTVFVYAKLWRRSKVLTDLEFYELRYSGKGAAFLRGFRAFYLGAVFNILIMASVCLAGIKIGGALLGLSPVETLLISCAITVIYSSIGGLRGIIITDFFQFILAMVATFWAAYEIVSLPQIQGLTNLLNHPDVIPKLSLIPDIADTDLFIAVFIIPLAVQWWAVWYPGAEPGGGGYVAQRMLSAKDEKNAIWATLLFNFMHYAVRPWPWILIALASIVVFPNLESLQVAFPNTIVGNDLAYPAMISFLPSGLLGLLVASLIVKNLGRQINNYTVNAESINPEIQFGICKELKYLPFKYHLTYTNINTFDISSPFKLGYQTNVQTGQLEIKQESIAKTFLRHIIIGGELNPYKKSLFIRGGFNFQRRFDMTDIYLPSSVGFSFGIGFRVYRYYFDYSRSFYHLSAINNNFSITTNLSSFGF